MDRVGVGVRVRVRVRSKLVFLAVFYFLGAHEGQTSPISILYPIPGM